MLLLPNAIYQLFTAGTTKSQGPDRTDVEKEGAEARRISTAEDRRGMKSHRRNRRPSELVIQDNNIQSFYEGSPAALSDNQDSTQTRRILPIFSGIMIPFSIMLSIPGLTGHWYIRTGDNNVTIETRSNPLLLNVAMGLSLGCGVMASACLVVRFAERKIRLMTLASIIFLSLHDIINIPAVTIFGVQHRFDDGFTYGQSFWMTVCSTIVSTVTNFTLVIDFRRTKDFTHSGSGLTPKQRSLVIIIIILLCYVSLGSLIQTVLMDITFINALYFSVVTIETIGFGDIPPTSNGARVFTCFYIAGGILNIALAVALAREALLESAALGFKERLKAARLHQRERRIRTRWRAAVRWRLRAKGLPVWVHRDRADRRRRFMARGHHPYAWGVRLSYWLYEKVVGQREEPSCKYIYGQRHKRLNLEVLTEAQLEAAALEAGAPLSELVPEGWRPSNGGPGTPLSPHPSVGRNARPLSLTHVRMGGMVSLMGHIAIAVTHGAHVNTEAAPTSDVDDDDDYEATLDSARMDGRGVPLTHTLPYEDENNSLATTLEEDERNAFYTRLSIALVMFVVFWMAGSAIFMETEGWSFGSAVYFCFISFTTVGYGDLSPRTPAGRSVFVVWALLGVGTMTILISILAEAYSARYKSVIRSEVYQVTTSTFDYASNDTRQPFSETRTDLNTNSEQASATPTGSTAFGSSGTPRNGRSRKPSMAPIPELQLSNERRWSGNRSTEELPHHVLRYTERLRKFTLTRGVDPDGESKQLGDSEWLDVLLAELDRSLQEMASTAREALDASHEEPLAN